MFSMRKRISPSFPHLQLLWWWWHHFQMQPTPAPPPPPPPPPPTGKKTAKGSGSASATTTTKTTSTTITPTESYLSADGAHGVPTGGAGILRQVSFTPNLDFGANIFAEDDRDETDDEDDDDDDDENDHNGEEGTQKQKQDHENGNDNDNGKSSYDNGTGNGDRDLLLMRRRELLQQKQRRRRRQRRRRTAMSNHAMMYRSIHPLVGNSTVFLGDMNFSQQPNQDAKSAQQQQQQSPLPSSRPQLSNRKYRLPMRVDVGFPNVSQDEIALKQSEIRLETMWEETSPRLLVLIPSDDFGTAVQQTTTTTTTTPPSTSSTVMDSTSNGGGGGGGGEWSNNKIAHTPTGTASTSKTISIADSFCPRLYKWNQGGWEGLPYAGRELIMAKEQNARHFGAAGHQNTNVTTTNHNSPTSGTAATKNTRTTHDDDKNNNGGGGGGGGSSKNETTATATTTTTTSVPPGAGDSSHLNNTAVTRVRGTTALQPQKKAAGTSMTTISKRARWKRNRANMLAPPLDATYSSTARAGFWRSRPFLDAPPGRRYVLIAPLKIHVEDLIQRCHDAEEMTIEDYSPETAAEDMIFGGDDEETTAAANGAVAAAAAMEHHPQEPLVCSVALYLLPRRRGGNSSASTFRPVSTSPTAAAGTATATATHAAAFANNSNHDINQSFSFSSPKTSLVYGKLSEEFYVPAGDWRGKVHLEDSQKTSSKSNRGRHNKDSSSSNNNNKNNNGNSNNSLHHQQLLEAWHGRKHKGLFSFDSHRIVDFDDDDDGDLRDAHIDRDHDERQQQHDNQNGQQRPPQQECGEDADDPNNLPSVANLHVVLQVYKLATLTTSGAAHDEDGGDSITGATHASSSGGKKGLGQRIKNKLKRRRSNGMDNKSNSNVSSAVHNNGSWASPTHNHPELASSASARESEQVYEQFGTQLLTPVCFGVAPLWEQEPAENGKKPRRRRRQRSIQKHKWPESGQRTMMLHPCASAKLESQTDFVQHLISILTTTDAASNGDYHHHFPSHHEEMSEGISGVGGNSHSSSGDPGAVQHHKRRFPKLLRSPAPQGSSSSSSRNSNTNVSSTTMSQHQRKQALASVGSATFFVSDLGVDFTQSMLVDPPELAPSPTTRKTTTTASSKGISASAESTSTPTAGTTQQHALTPTSSSASLPPRLLVDVTGDRAIALTTPQSSSSRGPVVQVLSAVSESGPEQQQQQQQQHPDHPSAAAAAKKRSNLVRLPPIPSAGYVSMSCDIRELQYLPPRGEKQFDVDVPTSSQSMLNLLYIYPRVLKLPIPNHNGGYYTIRIRLVRSEVLPNEQSAIAESHQSPLLSFYNPTPWDGSPMVDRIFTKVQSSSSSSSSSSTSASTSKDGLFMRDEFKMRLPVILDGTYYLQFTLFHVKTNLSTTAAMTIDFFQDEGGGVDLDATTAVLPLTMVKMAETLIPLSSSSNREAKTGVRVTTVIPNGCHRLKLGDCQLQFETRLLSSLHIGDPTTATILRDFPVPGLDGAASNVFGPERLRSLALTPSRSIVGRMSPYHSDPAIDLKVTFQQLFVDASGSTLVGLFPLLAFMHITTLVSRCLSDLSLKYILPTPESESQDRQDDVLSAVEEFDEESLFLEETMGSFFEVIRKVKGKLGRDSLIALFVKDFIDGFDEGQSSPSSLPKSFSEDCQNSNHSSLYHTQTTATTLERSRSAASVAAEKGGSGEPDADGIAADALGMEDFPEDGGSFRRANDSLHQDIDFRISRTLSALSAKGVPFSRVAYGASKLDRMRLEAELNQEGANTKFSHLVDDDETVFSSLYHGRDNGEYNNYNPALVPSRIESGNTWLEDDGFLEDCTLASTLNTPDVAALGARADGGSGGGGFGFAKRVRIAAQEMIAPCMTPSLAIVLSANSGSMRHGEGGDPNGSGAWSASGPIPLGGGGNPGFFPKQIENSAHNAAAAATTTNSDNKTDSSASKKRETIVEEGSDSERDEVNAAAAATESGTPRFRAESECPFLVLSVGTIAEEDGGSSLTCYAYEALLMLWVKAWNDYRRESNDKKAAGLPLYLNNGSSSPRSKDSSLLVSFYNHLDFILPLCLKSMALRFSEVLPSAPSANRVILDENHMKLLEANVEVMARGLMSDALTPNDGGGVIIVDHLVGALESIEVILDFLIGLASTIHTQQLSVLLSRFLLTLREYEISPPGGAPNEPFVWSPESVLRVKCSRQLRLRTAERFAVYGAFIPSNFPLKYAETRFSGRSVFSSWKRQKSDRGDIPDPSSETMALQPDGVMKLPRSGWLADLLVGECLSICSLSCEAVVAEAIALVEVAQHGSHDSPSAAPSALKGRPGKSLTRKDLLLFQSMAIHSITIVHELLLRRHAMDARFQSSQARSRVAALFASPFFSKSLSSTRWLARMESTHTVRSLWLACFVYILQEAPDSQLRALLRSYCTPPDFKIHRFVRLLRLSCSTFQSLVDEGRCGAVSENMDLSPWLLQESFNTICATTNVVVEECFVPISYHPREQTKLVQGISDLLLHVMTVPQSVVTHLRSVGGALQVLSKFGVESFFEVVGDNLQHWFRVMLTLMNSISLSVRAISVDWIISLIGDTFNLRGNIDEISLFIATVLPEVIAREIALYSVSGLITKMEELEKAVWPIRRSLADIEGANPLSDDRVDPQLLPTLATLCRSCQAIIDGVLIELRLKGENLSIVGNRIRRPPDISGYTFDADEESLFEAASFFHSETAPLQKLRWLHTLTLLHESKGQWVEAAETLMLCARTISDSIPHLRTVWTPSEFVLWHDDRRSLWLETIGKDGGKPDQGNVQVMQFAASFLEPPGMFGREPKQASGSTSAPAATATTKRLEQPTIAGMCELLSMVSKKAIEKYLQEEGLEELAYSRLESLLRVVMNVVEDHGPITMGGGSILLPLATRRRMAQEDAALRKVSAILNAELTRLAERVSLGTSADDPVASHLSPNRARLSTSMSPSSAQNLHTKGSSSSRIPQNAHTTTTPTRRVSQSTRGRQHFVRVVLSGVKPKRFTESTTIPTFVEWENPCICRVPKSVVEMAAVTTTSTTKKNSGMMDGGKSFESRICSAFAQSLRDALARDDNSNDDGAAGKKSNASRGSSVVFRNSGVEEDEEELSNGKTYLDISMVFMDPSCVDRYDDEVDNDYDGNGVVMEGGATTTTDKSNRGESLLLQSKRFFYRKASSFPLQSTPPQHVEDEQRRAGGGTSSGGGGVTSTGGTSLPALLRGVATNLVELTVAHPFPCPLSRQRTLITSEFMGEN